MIFPEPTHVWFRHFDLPEKPGQPSVGDLGWIALFGTLTFVVGGLFFRYLKRGFADVL
ncbi:MAG TPA: hypothetical protein VEF06_00070 [Bryobacteraceae bacterium]|nr:hypothetical protein [Bryobacteraceae bacterium]